MKRIVFAERFREPDAGVDGGGGAGGAGSAGRFRRLDELSLGPVDVLLVAGASTASTGVAALNAGAAVAACDSASDAGLNRRMAANCSFVGSFVCSSICSFVRKLRCVESCPFVDYFEEKSARAMKSECKGEKLFLLQN